MLARYWRTKLEAEGLIITPEDARLARLKRRIIVIGSLVLVFAIVFGVFGARPAGRAIKAWQARRHAQKAFAFINKEQWSAARAEAMAAYRLSPGQPQALRAVARFLTRTHSIEALDFWKELSIKTSLTRLDVRDEAMIAIIAGDMALADTAVRKLIDSHAEPADWLLAAQLAVQKNLPDEAELYLAKIVADSRATASEQFRAALLQFSLAANSPSERDLTVDYDVNAIGVDSKCTRVQINRTAAATLLAYFPDVFAISRACWRLFRASWKSGL